MICEKCHVDKPDALRRHGYRNAPHFGNDPALAGEPVLCTACCSRYPGREWMRREADAAPPDTWTLTPEEDGPGKKEWNHGPYFPRRAVGPLCGRFGRARRMWPEMTFHPEGQIIASVGNSAAIPAKRRADVSSINEKLGLQRAGKRAMMKTPTRPRPAHATHRGEVSGVCPDGRDAQ